MDQPLLPAFILGIGEFGALVLADLAEQIGHAYGPQGVQAVSLLSVGLGEQPSAPQIPYYNLYQDATDWLNRPAQSSAAALYEDWLVPAARGRRPLTVERLLAQHNRQWVRLMFLKHLASRQEQLMRFFQRDTGRVLRLADTQIYILASLDEVLGSALLLDLADVLRRALYEVFGRQLRSIAYLALPSARPESEDENRQIRIQANAFACLRELEQARLTTYISASELLPSQSNCPIEYVRLYGDKPHAIDALATHYLVAQWSDALLIQLDRQFGANFIEVFWTNLEKRQRDTGVEDELLVGTQRTASAVFPAMLLQEMWSTRLARMALEQHLRLNLSAQQAQSELKRWIVRQVPLPGETGSQVSIPRLLKDVLAFDTSPMSIRQLYETADTSLAMLETVLCARGDPYAGKLAEIAKHASATLGWEPKSEDSFRETDVRSFCEWMEKELKQRFGPLDSTLDDPQALVAARGTYYIELQHLADEHLSRFHLSLLAVAQRLLDDVGIIHALTALQNLAGELRQSQKAVEEALRRLPPISGRVNQLRHLSTATITLTSRTILGGRAQPSQEVRSYVAQAREITVMLKQRIALYVMAELLGAFIRSLEKLLPCLEVAAQALSSSNDALFPRIVQREKALEERMMQALHTGDRYWLFSMEWADTFYNQHIYPHKEDVASQLAWRLRSRGPMLNPSAEVECIWTLLQRPLQIPGSASADEREHVHEENLYWLLHEAEHSVTLATDNLNLWDYVLSQLGRYHRAMSEISEALVLPESLLSGLYPENVWRLHYLLEPDKSRALPQQTTLIDRLLGDLETGALYRYERRPTGSRAHIRTFVNTDLIPLRRTNGYLKARDAYLHLPMRNNARERKQSYVYPREAAAAELEIDLMRSGLVTDAATQLAPSTVALLVNRERLDWLVWMDALGWLDTTAYYGDAYTCYALHLPSLREDTAEVVWLGQPGAYPDYYRAVHDFCLRDALSTQTHYGGEPTPFTEFDWERCIELGINLSIDPATIEDHADSEGADYWEWAISVYQRDQQREALQWAYRAELMEAYSQHSLGLAHDEREPYRDLRLMLAQIARNLFNEYRSRIQNKRLL